MAINPRAKTLTTLSVTATKNMGDGIRAWFAVAAGDDHYVYVDKKLKDPAKFSSPDKVKKILTGLGITRATTISSRAALISGTVKTYGQDTEIVIVTKKNGGSKTILKGFLKDASFKKMVPNAKIVKTHTGEEQSGKQEAEQAEDSLADELMSSLKLSKTQKKAFKIYLWWHREARREYRRITTIHAASTASSSPLSAVGPSDENEDEGLSSSDADFLQKALRRLTSFKAEKLYRQFESKWWSLKSSPLAGLKAKNFDLQKSDLTGYISDIEEILESLTDDEPDSDEEVDEDIKNAAIELGVLESYALRLELNEADSVEFMSAAQGYLPILERLFRSFDKTAILAFKEALGDGSWEMMFTQSMICVDSLQAAVSTVGSVKNLCKSVGASKAWEPFAIVFMAAEASSKDAFIEQIKAEKKRLKKKKKVTSFKTHLFMHPDIRPRLTEVFDELEFTAPIAIEAVVNLRADNPDVLKDSLNNPRILQKIKDAGNFEKMIKDLQDDYVAATSGYDPEVADEDQEDEINGIVTTMNRKIAQRQQEAVDRAEEAAKREFGLEAAIAWDTTVRVATCVWSVGMTALSVSSTIVGSAASLGAGLFFAHGLVKQMATTFYQFKAFLQGFDKNIENAEACFKEATDAIIDLKNSGSQLAVRLGTTLLGEFVDPVGRGNRYLDIAGKDLDKIDLAVNKIVDDLNRYLNATEILEGHIAKLKEELDKIEDDSLSSKVSELEERIDEVASYLSGTERIINQTITACSSQSTFVTNAQERIANLTEVAEQFKPNAVVKTIITIWDVAEFAGGIVAGGAILDSPLYNDAIDFLGNIDLNDMITTSFDINTGATALAMSQSL